ncbi:translation initiation factor eIF-2B subunit delta-like isoform X1 [Macadamia integrifolia]|uniref:translation initiation factor eIF-2B subunit delta-like isoform X1 n=2 Tax=Macadamia integrifolia TaxID=60698 RepID=UPI001C527D2F|nr:translation initiation factor eIF-2B subunit delta-like isoform X1 [Macadamia integrifolia]
MEPRRTSRMVIDPKVRHVGFVTFNPATNTGGSPPVSQISPSGNSLSPVMIPPPRHASDNVSSSLAAHNSSRAVPVHVPLSPLRRNSVGDDMRHGNYNPPESLLGTSPSPSSKFDGGDFFEEDDMSSTSWIVGGNPGTLASSFPGSGFDPTSAKSSNLRTAAANLITASVVKIPTGASEKDGESVVELQNEWVESSKPLKEKTSKAERRALQEAQRAAKAAAKADGSKTHTASGGPPPMNTKQTKAVKTSQQKDVSTGATSIAASEKKGGDRPPEKDRKKDVPPPRMQFDDKQRVEKAKRRAVVKQTEARNKVDLFRHLPQYEHGTQLPDLESKFFLLDPMHPAIYKVGLQYLAGDISGGNSRCIAMLQAFKETIQDYSTPPEKSLNRDLTAKIGSYVSFFIECRPLSISMGNAIRVLKNRISKLPVTLCEAEAKAALCADIDRFINEKIVLADKVIVRHAVTKIRDGDVLLTYGSSCVVEMMLLYAHELGKQFRVVVVDSRPMLEGQALIRRLVVKGISCTYTHINAVSCIMHEVTRVFLGAASVLSNGTVYSRVGTACVAMVAHAFHIPVLVCCEAYKFHERVQLDSICFNELGDPDVIAKVPGRKDVNHLDSCTNNENLQLLNLMYDVTPSDYVSMIITDYGMVPTTSVSAIVREYRRECLWI